MDLTDEFRIETPEQIDLDLELAGLGTRFIAQVYDWVIKSLISIVLMFVLIIVAGLFGIDADLSKHAGGALLAVVIFIFFVLWLGYDIYFESQHNGRTPGKKAFGCRVIRVGGAPIDATAAAIRNLLGLADFLPAYYLLGALLILLTDKKQRLGDMAGGTIVVRDRKSAVPAEATLVANEYAVADVSFTAGQLAKCTPADRQVLRSFFLRLPGLPPDSRDKLAFQLADSLRRRIDYVPAGMDPRPTAFLGSLLRDLETRQRQGY